MWKTITDMISNVTGVAVSLIGLSVALEIVFGSAVPFLSLGVINNISAIVYTNQEGSWNLLEKLGDGKKSTIRFSSFIDETYSIQVSHNLEEWVNIESNIKGTGFEIIKNYTLPGNTQFFRITEKSDE